MQEKLKAGGGKGQDQIIPLRGMRGMIADKMHQSLLDSAQLTHHAECEATALFDKKARLAADGVKVSIEDLLLWCVISTLSNHPALNGVVKERQIYLSPSVHLSLAIALPGNLLVAPAIFNAGSKTLAELAAARKDLIARAKANKLSVTEMTGGTFTVSNLGLSRVRFFTPILNTPQIAILGLGQTVERARTKEGGGIVMRPVMGLSLTFDHRAVDGAPAAAFLSDLCGAIEKVD